MQSVALISGLIGALISAGLSYWIRANLDRRNLREAEKRLAYVHSVRISELVAIWGVFFEEKNTSWVTAETVHDQWITITKFIEQVRILRISLLKSSAVPVTEASELLTKQVETYNERFHARYKNQPKLQAATNGLKESPAIVDASA